MNLDFKNWLKKGIKGLKRKIMHLIQEKGFLKNRFISCMAEHRYAASVRVNPLVPTQEKFARFRSVQKCTFLVFRPKFDSVPSKIFLPENNSFRQNSIFFLLMPFKKSYNLPFGRDGQKTQGRSDQKLLFFLFFTKNDIKTLFE